MKKLLIAPAGAGKTHQLLSEFTAHLKNSPDPLRPDAFFILPSSEHVDRMTSLALQQGLEGFFHPRITTLPRLMEMLLPLNHEPLASSSARYLILREMMEARVWPYFDEVQKSSGFQSLVLHFIAELKDSLVDPETFRTQMNRLKTLEPDLAPKYEALASFYEEYQRRLTQQGLKDRQDLFYAWRGREKNPAPVRFKKIWLDGFFDFSGLQLAYLEELCRVSDEITIALTEDAEPKRPEVFHIAEETRQALSKLGFESRFLKNSNQRTEVPALQHLEKYLFQAKPPKSSPPVGNALAIFEAVGIQGEIEMIAREIRSIIRKTSSIRFSEFAVLLRQIGSYDSVLRSVFERYGIPVEIHERERLKLSPLIQTVVDLLQIFRENWKKETVMNFLHSSYIAKLGKAEKSLDFLYMLDAASARQGIFEGREEWLKDWSEGTEKNLPADFNQKKMDVLAPLRDLEDSLKSAGSFPGIRNFLGAFLGASFAIFPSPFPSPRVAGRGEGEGRFGIQQKEGAVLRRLEALFEEIGRHFQARGKETVSFEEFSDHFFKLVELDLYSLHERDSNRVQVYDVSMARQKEYRVVFVAGLLEKSFPLLIKEDPILSDWERRLMNSQMSPGALQERLPRQHLERYFFYLAVTRARELVILSYPRIDREGKESLPSFYVDEVKRIFNSEIPKHSQNLSQPYPSIEEVQSKAELETAVIGELWHGRQDEEPVLLYLINHLLEAPKNRELFRRAQYQIAAQLTDPAIQALDLFRSLRTSASRLEEYARCPFKYFSNYVLNLKDPHEDPNARNQGSVRHYVLEHFFGEIKKGRKLQTEEQINAFIEKKLAEALKIYPLVYEKKYQHELANEQLAQDLREFIAFETDFLSKNVLQPARFEFAFGTGETPDAPAYTLEVAGKKVQITGKIDRIDLDPKEEYALVVDYKPKKEFKEDQMDFGLALQLPIYVEVVGKALGWKPVGAEFSAIRKLKRSGFYHEGNAAGLLDLSSKRKGKWGKDEFEQRVARSMEFIKYFVRKMMRSEIPVQPRECEDYCPFDAVCRVQKWRREEIQDQIREDDVKWQKETGKW